MFWKGGKSMRTSCQIFARRRGLFPAALIYSSLCAGASVAQEASPAPEAPATAGVLQEVIVTAQKRSQNIQDVPISITAITEKSLDMRGATGYLGYFGSVPGLSFQSAGPVANENGTVNSTTILSLRGIAATTGSNTVGFYINDTPMQFVDPGLFDVARIEVLRGPQGTLYGASSMGGTIRIITNDPDSHAWGGDLEGTLSETQHGGSNIDANAMFNVPLVSDHAALRVVAFSRDDSGYINNIIRGPTNSSSSVVPGSTVNLGGSDTRDGVNTETLRGGRAALRMQFLNNDALTVDLSDMQQDLRIGGDPTYKVVLDPTDPSLSYGTIAPLVNDFTHDALVTHDVNPAPQEEKFSLYDATIHYEPGPVSVVSSTSYYDRDTSSYTDLTEALPFIFGMAVPVANNLLSTEGGHALTEELHVSGKSSAFDWLVGVFYQNVFTRFQQSLVDPDFNDEVFGGAEVVPDGVFLAFLSNDSAAQTAVFSEDTYHVTRSLDLTAGIRYFRYNDTTSTVADGLFNGGPTSANVAAHDSGNTPKVSVSYKLTEDALVYATVSKGFRPGFGLQPVGSACDPTLAGLGLPAGGPLQAEPDSLWNHEIGFKTSFADRRLIVNGAGYEMDWNNIQQNLNLGSCGYSTTVNSGSARSVGFELEVSAMPADGLELNVSSSMSNAYLTSNAATVGAVPGDPVLDVAKWHASSGITYTRPVRAGYDGYAHADYQYTGPMISGYQFGTPELDYAYHQPGYSVTDFRFGVRHNGWDVALFMENATNSRPRLSAGYFESPDLGVYTIRPRTLGINIKEIF
jgi:outer membrane receptor protein involved in Fe transport